MARLKARSSSERTTLLLKRARRGDASAFGTWLERHRERWRRRVARRCGGVRNGGADEDDVVQDAALAAWAEIREGQAPATRTFGAWFSGILRNRQRQFAHSVRRQRREEMHTEHVAPLGPGTGQVGANEEPRLLRAAVSRLTPLQRDVFVLRHEAQLDYKEIGKRIGRSQAAAQMIHQRAKVALGRAMSGLRRGDRP